MPRRTSVLRALLGVTSLGVLALSTFAGDARAQSRAPAAPTAAPHHAKAPPTTKPGAPPPTTTKPVTKLRTPDTGARRAIAGGSTADDVSLGAESAELRALHDAERELFPPAMPAGPSDRWPSELPSPLSATEARPRVHASGLPPSPVKSEPPPSEGSKDMTWLESLTMPDLPVRWDARLVRYLEFFKDDPRGRATFAHLFKRSGRYREVVRRALKKKGLPEDLVWVAMMESGFDPVIRSPVGATGLWQFMPETGKLYGLAQDRWVDQRMNAQAATDAAADFLNDLHRRFGSWELALAAYNMGYGGMQSVVRRYNTNDFWALEALEGSLPWETSLYVPKILAAAVVSRNLSAFGFADVALDAAVEGDEVHVPAGTPLAAVASAAGCTTKEVEQLNPELRASRTPPTGEGDASPAYTVKVPSGKGSAAAAGLAKTRKDQAALERYVVRFGESLDQIAASRKVTAAKLIELNGIGAGEVVRGGTVILVPKADASAPAPTPVPAPKPTVIVPADVFVYPDRKRVFYRVLVGDTMKEIAAQLSSPVDDVRRWNNLDPVARLIEGMTLQAFVPQAADLSRVVVMQESDVRVVAIGSDEFFAYLEQQRGQRRITVTAKAGDTLESIGKRYQVPVRTMERINRRGRSEALGGGETIVVYVPGAGGGAVASGASHGALASTATSGPSAPTPNGPLPAPPSPNLLPPAIP